MMKFSVLILVVSSQYLHRSVSSVFFTKHMKSSNDIFVPVYVVKPNKWSQVIPSLFLTSMLDGGEQVTSSINRFSSTEMTPLPNEEGPVWASKPIQAFWGRGEYFVPPKS